MTAVSCINVRIHCLYWSNTQHMRAWHGMAPRQTRQAVRPQGSSENNDVSARVQTFKSNCDLEWPWPLTWAPKSIVSCHCTTDHVIKIASFVFKCRVVVSSHITTSVSETIRKTPLVKAQTALKTKKNKIWRKNDFQYGGWNSYTLQCGAIMTLISPGDCTLQCGISLESWQWIHQVAAPCTVAGGSGMTCHGIRPTSAILEFYIWFRFWPYHCSQHVILHQSAKFYLNRTTLNRKNDVMSITKMADLSHLGFQGSNNAHVRLPTGRQ